jgi:hypothetical protein
MTTLRLATALVALLAVAGPARATDVSEARAHFKRGAALYKAGQYRQAIGEFQAAYRAKPHGAIHFNIAQCRERLEEWPDALRSYEDYLREVPDARDRAAVRAAIGKIEDRLAAAGVQALLVYTDPPGAELQVDGKSYGQTPYHISLPPGDYRLTLSLDGYQRVEQDVTLERKTSRVVDVVLRPGLPVAKVEPVPSARPEPVEGRADAPSAASTPSDSAHPERRPAEQVDGRRAPIPTPTAAPTSTPTTTPKSADLTARPPPTSPLEKPHGPAVKGHRRVWTWVAAGAAAAALATGLYFQSAAASDSSTLRDGTVRPSGAATDLRDGARGKQQTATALYVVSGVAAAAGVTLFVVEGRF